MRALLLLLPALLLSACASKPSSSQATMTCNAEPAAALIGRLATPGNIEAARVAAGAASVRALGENDPMTLDFRADRLTVVKDAAGAISRVSCG